MESNNNLKYKFQNLQDALQLFEVYNHRVANVLRNNIAQDLYALRIQIQTLMLDVGSQAELKDIKSQLSDTILKLQNLSNDIESEDKKNINLIESFYNLALSMYAHDRMDVYLNPKILHLKNDIQQIYFLIAKYIIINSNITNKGVHIKSSLSIAGDLCVLEVIESNALNDKDQGIINDDYKSLLKSGLQVFNFLFVGDIDFRTKDKDKIITLKLKTVYD